ncbi:hypothetical protein MGN70_009204 [Eutypa lata]|uniref:Putative lea domain-containing protein n=1 Tax=Eutypa lata (strain UCR-EL1) TaxID=1287681 RepID=M7SZL9_EUTLA|nr:putative lea domain-containing protein [Eutypa lata UCREL1]KAI1249591.1 hypothetical protein MGN70_009204 [Eutypa lata]
MSYLSEITARRMALTARASLVQAPRQFSTSIAAQKSATESVKDGLKTVDRKVSDKLVDGINAGAAATDKVKKATTGATESTVGNTKASAEELRGQAKGKAAELKGEAKGAAKEAEGKVKGSL